MIWLIILAGIFVLSLLISAALNPVNFFVSALQLAAFAGAILMGIIWWQIGEPWVEIISLSCILCGVAWLGLSVLRYGVLEA